VIPAMMAWVLAIEDKPFGKAGDTLTTRKSKRK
jgi:hypothetical protein